MFVSYTQADRAWAEWIAWQLEDAGLSVVLQAWDFAPGRDWVHEMNQAASSARQTVAVLSSDYLRSPHGETEWRVAYSLDPSGERQQLIPVRVADCHPRGLLRTRVYADLFGLDEAEARARLLAALCEPGARGKPSSAPMFPGSQGSTPRFPGAVVRFGVPLRSAFFLGRKQELRALERAGASGARALVTQAIVGLGGVGKTQLAVAYEHEHAGDYDVVAWVRAEDGGVADLAQLATVLGTPVDGLSPEESAERVVRWLEACDERWLLVLDNVTAPAQLSGSCPRSGNGHVIVTSRDRGLDEFAAVLALDAFDEPTAAKYLVDRARRPHEREAARRLARALGGLPLALAHAGAYCSAGTSFADYHELLDALPAAEMFDERPEASYEQTVAATWQVSIDAASAQAPHAQAILAAAAYLAPEGIPVELLESLLDDATDPRQRKPLRDGLNALARYSLAAVDGAQVSVHRLLQKVVRDEYASRQDPSAAARALSSLVTAFPDAPELPDSWPRCERLLPHVDALAEAAPQLEAGELVTLLDHACGYLASAGGGHRFVNTTLRALELAERRLGAEHPQTLKARGNLARSYWSAGRTDDAISTGEAVLADYERLLGAEHTDTLKARAGLASSYWSAGRIDEAIVLEEAVLADRERLLGAEHTDTLKAHANLAGSYWSAGRIDEAIVLEEAVLADYERLLGAEHTDTLKAHANLAGSYWSAGRIDEAIVLEEAVLADYERLLGAEHTDTLKARANLAGSYWSAGRIDDAISIAEAVLADCERLLGAEHPQTLTARGNLAQCYSSAGRTDDAISIGEAMLADCERLLGAEHPQTLTARGNLAQCYSSAGRTDDAISIGEAVLADCERLLGAEHPQTLKARAKLISFRGSADCT